MTEGNVIKFSSAEDEERYNRSRARRGRGTEDRGQGTGDRTLPHSIEAEEQLLSCCLLDGADVITRAVKAGIGAGSFYVPAHGVVFKTLLEILGQGKPCDVSVVAEELKASGHLEAVGGYAFLTQVSSRIPTTAQAGYFIERVRGLALRREVARAAEAAFADACVERAGEDVDDFCAAQEERFLRITRARVGAGRAAGGALPALLRCGDLLGAVVRPEPPQLIAGLIHRGGKVMLGGGSKSFKTWVLLAMAIAVATGRAWWGLQATKGRVLFVNFELQLWSFEGRVRSICEALKIPLDDPDLRANFTSWHLRGYAADLGQLIPQFLVQTVGSKYDMIILDPIYKCLGERDENANGEVAGLLNEVEALAVRSDAAVVFGHHFSKGNQSAKDARDRVSGAGAWTRDPDTVITLTPHEEEDCFAAEFVLRDLKPRAPMVVRWQHPCMLADGSLDPNALRQPGRPNEHTVEAIVELLRGEEARGAGSGLTYSKLLALAERKKKMSASTFKRKLKEATESGRVESCGGVYFVSE